MLPPVKDDDTCCPVCGGHERVTTDERTTCMTPVERRGRQQGFHGAPGAEVVIYSGPCLHVRPA